MINFSSSSYLSKSTINKNNSNSFKAREEQKQKLINQQYNDIYEHEQAHKNAAGSLGGAIVIEKNADGIPVGGHVDVKMPALDKKNPDKTIKHADTVINSALAPKDPSGQDIKVASEARSIKSKALSEKNNASNPINQQGTDLPRKTGKILNLMA